MFLKQQISRVISEGSRDTVDWSNDEIQKIESWSFKL